MERAFSPWFLPLHVSLGLRPRYYDVALGVQVVFK